MKWRVYRLLKIAGNEIETKKLTKETIKAIELLDPEDVKEGLIDYLLGKLGGQIYE